MKPPSPVLWIVSIAGGRYEPATFTDEAEMVEWVHFLQSFPVSDTPTGRAPVMIARYDLTDSLLRT